MPKVSQLCDKGKSFHNGKGESHQRMIKTPVTLAKMMKVRISKTFVYSVSMANLTRTRSVHQRHCIARRC